LGLTQIELAKLLGLGLSTISRYENGALQDSSHDSLIRLSLEPNNIIKLLEQSNGVLSESHKEKMLKGLADIQKESYSLEKVIEIIFSRENPDVENGFAKVNLTKLFNAMLFLSKDGVWKTKLNKLLFYIDFKHFKDYGVPITGLKYVHLPYGPCPNKYELLLASLYANENIYSDEIDFSNGNMGDLIKPLKEPDLNVYSTSELQILAYVKQYFKEFSAGAITEYSHKENGYLETNQGDFISYEYAKSLHL
jgi:transcriptional regulator with XRE-family HTH domain